MTEQVSDALNTSLRAQAKAALTEKGREVFYVSPGLDHIVQPTLMGACWKRTEIDDPLTPGGKSIQYTKPTK